MKDKLVPMLHDDWKTNPFWLLMSCYFWDRDVKESIRVLRLMHDKWPLPSNIERASKKHMEEHVRCVGLRAGTVRSMQQLGFWFDIEDGSIERMSAEYLEKELKASPYMVEAWRLFIEKNLDHIPKFDALRTYHAIALRQRDLPNA